MRKAWDELVFPPPSAVPHTLHWSGHLGYIQEQVVELGPVLPSMWFCVSQPDRQFVCVARGLLFEGSMLAYDPTSKEAEWIPVWGMAGDLSQPEEASTRELSNMVPHDSTEGVQRLDRFGEQRSENGKEGVEGSDAKESTTEASCEECMDQGYKGSSDEDEGDSTLDGSHSSTSSQGSVRSLQCYISGCHTGSISWADQCLSEDEGDHVLGDEEDTSCRTTEENDGEQPPTPPASLQD